MRVPQPSNGDTYLQGPGGGEPQQANMHVPSRGSREREYENSLV